MKYDLFFRILLISLFNHWLHDTYQQTGASSHGVIVLQRGTQFFSYNLCALYLVLQLTFPLLDYFATLTNNRTNEMVPIMGIPKDMIHMAMLGPLKIMSCLPYPGYEITSSNHRSSPRHNRLTCFSLYRTSVRSELLIEIKFTDRSDEVGSGFFYQMHHAMEFEVI